MFNIVLGRATGGLDVEDFAGFVESDSRATAEGTAALLAGVVFAGGLGLLVGFAEGAAEDPGSGDDDLGDDSVRLEDDWVSEWMDLMTKGFPGVGIQGELTMSTGCERSKGDDHKEVKSGRRENFGCAF